MPWAGPSAQQSVRAWHGGDTAPADEGEVADRAALLNGDTAGMGDRADGGGQGTPLTGNTTDRALLTGDTADGRGHH